MARQSSPTFYVAERYDGTYVRKSNRDHRWRSRRELAKALQHCWGDVKRVFAAQETVVAEICVSEWCKQRG